MPRIFSNDDCLDSPWSRVHSFYANMGGFVIDLEEICQSEGSMFTTKVSRLTLTPRGWLFLQSSATSQGSQKRIYLTKTNRTMYPGCYQCCRRSGC